MDTISPELYAAARDRFTEAFSSRRFTPIDLVLGTTVLMEFAKGTQLSGSQKKDLVTRVLQVMINERLTPEERMLATVFVQYTLPSMIDTLINVAKGQSGLSSTEPPPSKCFCF